LIIYYCVVKTIGGESVKPWLGGEQQTGGIVGVGTYKRSDTVDEESI
jgi:hypothetical protein